MNDGMRGDTIRQIRTLFDVGTVAGLTDGQLLERFSLRGDEAAELAFAALVERHGATVLRVCRGVLRDSHDAEDAFQATFLVLARKARSIRRCESVGSWLYGVALRVSADALAQAARRRLHEQRAAQMTKRALGTEGDDELRSIIQEEVGRLPERYRAAIIVCDLEGRTGEDAARLLGWPLGTVRSRLARARERLRGRLAWRGVAPSLVPAAGLPIDLRWPDAVIDVPSALAEATVRLAFPDLACRAAVAGTVPAAVAALTNGALRAMLIAKLKTTVAAALLIALAMAGTSVLARHAPGPPDDSVPPLSSGRAPSAGGLAGARNEPTQVAVDDSTAGLLARNDRPGSAEPVDGQSNLESRGPSLQELEILRAQARRRLARYESLSKRAGITQEQLDDARTDVDILSARLEARLEDLKDELERLEARLLVKEAEESVVAGRTKATASLHEKKITSDSEVEYVQRELGVKHAEVQEVKIRISQIRRRLKRAPSTGPDPALP